MMSLGIGCNIVGKGKWGFSKQYKGCLFHEGRGTGDRAQGIACFCGLDITIMRRWEFATRGVGQG
jgi:hypothetical protein